MTVGASLVHIAFCVSNLEASTQFYNKSLGFEPGESVRAGAEISNLTELKNPEAVVQFLSNKDGLTIELVQFISPGGTGDRTRCDINRYGITHLTFRVESLDVAAMLVKENGGEVHWQTLYETEIPEGLMAGLVTVVVCTDPDGTRIELCEHKPL